MHRLAWPLGLIFAARVFGAGCTSIVGEWKWVSGGVTTFTANHTVSYDGKPFGTWTCTDAARDVLALKWANGFVDTLTISGDQVSGRNQVGMVVSGTRMAAARTPKDLAGPVASRTGGASPQAAVVTASGALQGCLGINLTAGTFTGDKPATMSYCKQLPGWDLYDQRASISKLETKRAPPRSSLAQQKPAMP